MEIENQYNPIIGASSAIKRVRHLIQQVANKFTTVLILGESGTGKELIAKVIHDLSGRNKGAFIPLNCAAIPLELLESELFGHEKGAFTGAYTTRQGRFELAAGGTLFLDEIGDMPISMQAKLLRVLQERIFERVGGNKPLQADVRIIAATHKNLEYCVKAGTFREDLYYRLNVFPIEIPPLRERREDIPLLIQHFIEKFKMEMGTIIEVAPEALQFLTEYEWRGNVRELANLIERLLILMPQKTITKQDLPTSFFRQSVLLKDQDFTLRTIAELVNEHKKFDLKEHLSALELDLIIGALRDSQGIVARAAKKLGLRRTTLVEKMKKYGIGREMDYKPQRGMN